ncbi:hypothetical protein B0J12DRAFT_575637, partial [Macrophomina phaseolina]
PVMWHKSRMTLAGPGNIATSSTAATHFLDFEGEPVIVTSKYTPDISVEDAPVYIREYILGNVLTAPAYQDPKREGWQFTRCKAFGNFVPLGPVLTSPAAFGTFKKQTITTKVNGKVFQESFSSLIHGPAALISFPSQGTTLPAGPVVMVASPPGIGFFQNPKSNLKNGDAAGIEISSTGFCKMR